MDTVPVEELQTISKDKGTLRYQVIDELKGTISLTIDLKIPISDYKKIQLDLKPSYCLYMLDRTMSMQGVKLDTLKYFMLKTAKRYYNKGKQQKLVIVLWDHRFVAVEGIDTYEEFKNVIEEKFTPGGSTEYSQPLKFLRDFITQRQVSRIKCLFLTDG